MKKTICMIAAVMLMLTFPLHTLAMIPKQDFATVDSRLNSVFEYQLSTMEGGENLNIAKIKSATDFVGNEYTIVECEPTGYMIYDNSNGIFTEYSSSAESPYLGITGTIFYCGPANYFSLNSTESRVEHTIKDNVYIALEDIEDYSAACMEYKDAYNSISNPIVLDYIENGNPSKSFAEITMQNATVYSTRSATDWQKITRADFFENLTAPGYTDEGICGYIALGMVLAYKDKVKNDSIMDDRFWADSSKTALVSYKYNSDGSIIVDASNNPVPYSIGYYLYDNFGGGDKSVTSVGIGNVGKKYFTNRNAEIGTNFQYSYLSRTVPFFNSSVITKALDSNQPVILCGNFTSPNSGSNVNHCVVAYAYRNGSNGLEYKVNFGWNNRSEIVLNGVIGSIYVLYTE